MDEVPVMGGPQVDRWKAGDSDLQDAARKGNYRPVCLLQTCPTKDQQLNPKTCKKNPTTTKWDPP